jgi:hypothetical protein
MTSTITCPDSAPEPTEHPPMGEPPVKGVVGWPGGLLWSSGWVGLFSWLLSQLPGFRAAARSGVKLETSSVNPLTAVISNGLLIWL